MTETLILALIRMNWKIQIEQKLEFIIVEITDSNLIMKEIGKDLDNILINLLERV